MSFQADRFALMNPSGEGLTSFRVQAVELPINWQQETTARELA